MRRREGSVVFLCSELRARRNTVEEKLLRCEPKQSLDARDVTTFQQARKLRSYSPSKDDDTIAMVMSPWGDTVDDRPATCFPILARNVWCEMNGFWLFEVLEWPS